MQNVISVNLLPFSRIHAANILPIIPPIGKTVLIITNLDMITSSDQL